MTIPSNESASRHVMGRGVARTTANSGDDLYDNPDSRLRYEAYSRLQAAAVAFGESLPIPEIVAIGGQSDGKSSLLEAFLGFRFNVREVEMGTRRPLVVQMVHDPTAASPRCRLQEEGGDEYGPVIPETEIAEAIRDRTESHLRQLNATVSDKAIVMRTEYAFCPNLTIIDTPGFILKARNGERDTTPDDIMEMVKAQAAPQHRLILFLQQSSVEWASSLWMHVVQEVDPTFNRTVVVASKFDNRLKEFSERWEVDRYLSATGYLSSNVKPFFVALPKERSITTSADFRGQIQETDNRVLQQLRGNIAGGFDEEKFGSHIGFSNLKTFLEEELAKRYRDSAPSTLMLLQERCEAVAEELIAAESALSAAEDVASLRRAAMHYVAHVMQRVNALLDGAGDCDPNMHGLTSNEERNQCRLPVWPGVQTGVQPTNSALRLFGGAAFERCIEEFQEAVKALDFPTVAKDRVANLLLAQRSRGQATGAVAAAEDIARATARKMLAPLLETACARLAAVMRKVFEIAADQMASGAGEIDDTLAPYVAFHAALRASYNAFVNKLEERAKGLVSHHLEAATSEWSIGLLSLNESWSHGDNSENTVPVMREKDTTETVDEREPLRESQLTIPETPSPEQTVQGLEHMRRRVQHGPDGRDIVFTSPMPVSRQAKMSRVTKHGPSKGGVYSDVCSHAARLFAQIRHVVACQATPSTLKAAFLDPIHHNLTSSVSMDMFARSDEDFMAMFNASGAVAALEARRDSLGRRVEGLVKCKNEFQELARCL
eukprot:jgi/Tetstr1/463334/TSEL_008257.t1